MTSKFDSFLYSIFDPRIGRDKFWSKMGGGDRGHRGDVPDLSEVSKVAEEVDEGCRGGGGDGGEQHIAGAETGPGAAAAEAEETGVVVMCSWDKATSAGTSRRWEQGEGVSGGDVDRRGSSRTCPCTSVLEDNPAETFVT